MAQWAHPAPQEDFPCFFCRIRLRTINATMTISPIQIKMVPTFSLIHCSMETHSFSDILGTFKILAASSDMGSKRRRGPRLPKEGVAGRSPPYPWERLG